MVDEGPCYLLEKHLASTRCLYHIPAVCLFWENHIKCVCRNIPEETRLLIPGQGYFPAPRAGTCTPTRCGSWLISNKTSPIRSLGTSATVHGHASGLSGLNCSHPRVSEDTLKDARLTDFDLQENVLPVAFETGMGIGCTRLGVSQAASWMGKVCPNTLIGKGQTLNEGAACEIITKAFFTAAAAFHALVLVSVCLPSSFRHSLLPSWSVASSGVAPLFGAVSTTNTTTHNGRPTSSTTVFPSAPPSSSLLHCQIPHRCSFVGTCLLYSPQSLLPPPRPIATLHLRLYLGL